MPPWCFVNPGLALCSLSRASWSCAGLVGRAFILHSALESFGVLIWGFLEIMVPPKHTPKWSFLVGKPMVVGETHHFRKHPFGWKTYCWWFRNSANQLRLGESAHYLQGGCLGFLNHQQYGEAGRVIGGITIFFPTAKIRSLVCQWANGNSKLK